MNPASRLLALYDRIVALPVERTLGDAWRHVLGMSDTKTWSEDDLITAMMAVTSEVDLVRSLLEARGVAPDLYDGAFAALRVAASPTNTTWQWADKRGNVIAPHIRLPFAWAAWLLIDEGEEAMPEADLLDLLAQIAALEQALDSPDISPYLRQFVQRQTRAIRAALSVYGVKGIQPLKDAVSKFTGDIVVHDERLRAEAVDASPDSRDVIAKAGVVLTTAATYADKFDKIYKAGEHIWKLGKNVVPLLDQWLK